MNLRDYIAGLNALAVKHPSTLDLEVITSKDDEGNGYNAVHFSPSVGFFDADDAWFYDDLDHKGVANVVCVN